MTFCLQPDNDQPLEVEELQHQITMLKRQLAQVKKSGGSDGKGQTDAAKKEQVSLSRQFITLCFVYV